MTEQIGPASTSSAMTVHRNEAAHRYEAHLDGTLVGKVNYRERGDEITLIHTETLDGFEGRGVGTALARSALADVQARGGRAVVLCPFIRAYLAKHPGEYDDIVVHTV